MDIPPTIFKGYDIRALYPQELNEENIVPIVKAIYLFFHKGKPEDEHLSVVVGTDMRTSSPSLTKVAIETLVGLGAQVIDIGVVSTPTFYFAVNHYGFEAGFQITASHNPKDYNGIKIVENNDLGIIKIGLAGGLDEIKNLAIRDESLPEQAGGTVIKKTGILEDEVENALKIVGNPQIHEFKIVADPGNAMGGQYIDALFKKNPRESYPHEFPIGRNISGTPAGSASKGDTG